MARFFEAWSNERKDNCPQFHYWSTAMELELCVLVFVRSLQEANFTMYVDTLAELAPWFHALDHTNYARWKPVHLRDMVELPKKHQIFIGSSAMATSQCKRPSECFWPSPLTKHTSRIMLVSRVMEEQLASQMTQVLCDGGRLLDQRLPG